jgi:hypothetical protein
MPLIAGPIVVAVAILVVAAAILLRAPGAEGDRRSLGLLGGRVGLFMALYWVVALLIPGGYLLLRGP